MTGWQQLEAVCTSLMILLFGGLIFMEKNKDKWEAIIKAEETAKCAGAYIKPPGYKLLE